MGKVRDIKGQKFNRLTAIEFDGLNKNNKALWKCKCDCGNEVTVIGSHLINGNTQSCGCYGSDKLAERNITHGGRHTKLYNTWCSMKDRCYREKSNIYKYYGARGISVCNEWLDDFATFRTWAECNGYAKDLTIERNDVDGNYEPSNCKWITSAAQARNKSNTVYIILNGVKRPMVEWADIFGINQNLVRSRYFEGKRGSMLFIPKAV